MIDEIPMCVCGHPQDDHQWPGHPECWASENDLGDVFCACPRYDPVEYGATNEHEDCGEADPQRVEPVSVDEVTWERMRRRLPWRLEIPGGEGADGESDGVGPKGSER